MTLEVGNTTDGWCGPCKLELRHTIEAMRLSDSASSPAPATTSRSTSCLQEAPTPCSQGTDFMLR